MIYAIVKNSTETIADIAKFKQHFLQPWGLEIISQQEREVNIIQLTISTNNRIEDDLAQILVRRYFTDKIVSIYH
ncbi:MAG: hypothetical protein AB1489_23520 [Acidobacteriota bacterium]